MNSKNLTAAQQPEDLKAWSLRMAEKEQDQYVIAGSHGIEDVPVQEGDGELPGMWSASDFTGSDPEERAQHRAMRTPPPSAPVEAKARAMFEAQADKLAAPWDRQWEPTKRYWREKAHQALTQQPAQAAPGWKLVPVEPTDGMLTAYYEADRRRAPCTFGWRAMLAAAPTPPGDDAAGERRDDLDDQDDMNLEAWLGDRS